MTELEHRIEHAPEKYCIGVGKEMSLIHNRTHEIFKAFMPRKNEILTSNHDFVVDLKFYPKTYFEVFDPAKQFFKYAGVLVSKDSIVPDQMELIVIPAGQYAVFQQHQKQDDRIFEYIFTEWLPKSKYQLDHRPHFDLIFTATTPDEIWIPIKLKA